MINFEIIRSDRRSISVEVTRDSLVRVRAPKRMSVELINEFVKKHSAWIEKKLSEAESRRDIFGESDESAILELISCAKKFIPERVAYWSEIMELFPTGIKITRAKTRYGSCSPKNSLCFSCYCMRLEKHEIDYIIVHELAHIKEKNHGKNFYAIIEKYLPDYRRTVYGMKHK